jgi:hypothetical protein
MTSTFNVGDIVKIKSEYHDAFSSKEIELVGVVTEITRSTEHEMESIRQLESHTGNRIDILKIMTSNGEVMEWFDDEVSKIGDESGRIETNEI